MTPHPGEFRGHVAHEERDPPSLEACREMLQFVDPAIRNTRVRVGEALRDEFGDAAFDVFDAWYSTHDRYTPSESKQAWRSFGKGGGKPCTIGTLIYEATRGGFKFAKHHQAKRSSEDRARTEMEKQLRRTALAAEAAEEHARAAVRAAAIWNAANEEPAGHAYLERKGIKATGVRRAREWVKEWIDPSTGEVKTFRFEDPLLVPIWSAPGKLASLQAILPTKAIGRRPRDGERDDRRDKDYLAGGNKGGCYFLFGAIKATTELVLICEGYATGASLHEAVSVPVMVAFDASNLGPVAASVRAKLPRAQIIIFSDRDAEMLAESGGTKAALHASLATGARIVVPEWTGQKGRDANDIHRDGFTWKGTTYPGKDILEFCVKFATPFRSPAFMSMLRECGIEAEDLFPEAVPGASETHGPQPDSDGAPTEILIEPGELTRTVDMAERALLARAPTIYTRAGRIVRPIRVPTTIADGKTADITQIKPLAKHALVEELTKVASWIKSDARRREGNERVRVNCPLAVAETLLARDQWSLRPLTAIINGPTLRSDGTVLEAPGYDQATGLLLEPHATFEPVPQQPSRGDALAALARLEEIVRDFPFVAPPDKSVWFAALFTAAIRRSLPTAPMFAFSAPSAGTGKSYMADLVAIITTGERSPVLAQGSNEEETEKRLGGVLLAGHTIVNIDNCTDAIEGDFLCQLLTQPIVQVRKLGGSDVCRVPGSSTMMATGNNLVIAGDMTRRALLCRLDAGVEQPELREFDFDPLEKAQRGRSAYLTDVLTILRAFHVAGRPTPPRPLGSFELWSSFVRGALLWLGMADPCDVMERSRKADPALSNLREVLHGLHKVFGNRHVLTREIIDKATAQASLSPALSGGKEFENPDLREALLAVAGAGGAINGNRLGKWLAAHRERPVDGLRLMEAGTNRDGVKLWMVASGDQGAF